MDSDIPLQISQAADDTEILEAQKNRRLARVQGPENFEVEGDQRDLLPRNQLLLNLGPDSVANEGPTHVEPPVVGGSITSDGL